MKIGPQFKSVGWGPFALPGEKRRRQRSYQEADALLERFEPSIIDETTAGGSGLASSIRGGGDGDTRIEHRPDSTVIPTTEVVDYRVRKTKAGSCTVGFITGDIENILTCDVWVNGENTDMEMARQKDASISAIIRSRGAIHGPSGADSDVMPGLLKQAVDSAIGEHRPVRPGSAFVTDAAGLALTNRVRWIIHVAAVQGEPGAGYKQIAKIETCVNNALLAAEELATKAHPAKSIIFPLLGTGAGGGDVADTVERLVNSAVNYVAENPETGIEHIYFLAYSYADRAALERQLQQPRLEPLAPQGGVEETG